MTKEPHPRQKSINGGQDVSTDSLVTWRFLKNLDGCPSKEDTNESFNGLIKRGDDSSTAGKDELMARWEMMEFDVFFGDPSKSFALRQKHWAIPKDARQSFNL